MTCRELADFIADYLSAELSPESLHEFQGHLEICPNCQKYLRSYEATVQLSKRAFDDDDAPLPASVPEELVHAVLTARLKSIAR